MSHASAEDNQTSESSQDLNKNIKQKTIDPIQWLIEPERRQAQHK